MFDYKAAFSRNIGWVTEDEQQTLKSKTVAIAGAGGVGFEHAVTLARLGIEKFVIADFDHFEIHNFRELNIFAGQNAHLHATANVEP